MKKVLIVFCSFVLIFALNSGLYAVTLDSSGTGSGDTGPTIICHPGELIDYSFEPNFADIFFNYYTFRGTCTYAGKHEWRYTIKAHFQVDTKEAGERITINTHLGQNHDIIVFTQCTEEPWLYSRQCTVLHISHTSSMFESHSSNITNNLPFSPTFLSSAQKSQLIQEYEAATQTVLEAPTNLRLLETHQGGLSIIWDDNSNNEEGFIVYRSEGDVPYVTERARTNKSVFLDSGCEPCTTYNYKVRAYYKSSFSDYAGPISSGILEAPENLAVSMVSEKITLSWSNADDCEKDIMIFMSTVEDGFTLVKIVDGNDTSFVHDFNYVANTTYTYRLKAFVPHKYSSDYSSAVSFTPTTSSTGSQTPPDAPSNVTAMLNNNQINLSWTDNSNNENGFKIEHSNSGLWEEDADVAANTTQFTIPYAPNFFGSVFRIYAYNTHGNSSYSNEAPLSQTQSSDSGLGSLPSGSEASLMSRSGGTDSTTSGLSQPTGLKYKALGPDSIMLYWKNKNKGVSGFTIERKKKGGIFAEIGKVNAKTLKFKDVDLEPGTIYYFRVRAFKDSVLSDYSKELKIKMKAKKETGKEDKKTIKQ